MKNCFEAVRGVFFGTPPAGDAHAPIWLGQEVDNRIHWTCTKKTQQEWDLKRGAESYGVYETVAETPEFIELRTKGIEDCLLVRIYPDKLAVQEPGGLWTTMATGRWCK